MVRIIKKRQLPNDGMIDWNWFQKKVHDFIRAFNFQPFTPARTLIGSRGTYVYESKIENGRIALTDVQFEKK